MGEKFAIIEFSSNKNELEIVAVSTLRGFDVGASLPFECICDWKRTGSRKVQSYTVNVLHVAGIDFYEVVICNSISN